MLSLNIPLQILMLAEKELALTETHACTAAAQMKESPLYVLFASPPPTINGTLSTCMLPIVRGFSKMTSLHCAGQRKSNALSSYGRHSSPFKPQPSLASQYVDVQVTNESEGSKKYVVRTKNASAVMYAAAKTTNSHKKLQGRVKRRIVLSTPNLHVLSLKLIVESRRGEGSN